MLGDALLHVGRHAEAERIFRDLAERDPDRRAQHLYNAGHAAHRGGRLDQAVKDFEAARQADPSLGGARTNLEAVKREIAARRQQQGPESRDATSGGEGTPGDAQESGASGDPGQGEGTPTAGQDAGKGARDGRKGAPGEPGAGDPRAGDPRDATEGVEAPQAGGQRESGDGGVRASEDPGTPADGAPLDPSGTAAGGAEGGPDEGPAAAAAPGGQMSKEAAARLVEAVPDGRPRVVVHGDTSGEDW
jgi:hypothetical protein